MWLVDVVAVCLGPMPTQPRKHPASTCLGAAVFVVSLVAGAFVGGADANVMGAGVGATVFGAAGAFLGTFAAKGCDRLLG